MNDTAAKQAGSKKPPRERTKEEIERQLLKKWTGRDD